MMEWGMVWRGNRESGNLELKKKDAELVGGGAAEEDAPKDLLAGTFRSCRTRRQGAWAQKHCTRRQGAWAQKHCTRRQGAWAQKQCTWRQGAWARMHCATRQGAWGGD
jgi:hypothetical protein